MIVPGTPGMPDASGVGASPIQQAINEKVTPKHLLMAAATMHELGRLGGKKDGEAIAKPKLKVVR